MAALPIHQDLSEAEAEVEIDPLSADPISADGEPGLQVHTSIDTSFVASDALAPFIENFEKLDKWKSCLVEGAPKRLVYEHNRTRAAGSGFPSRLEVGTSLGLTTHEVAAVFGWTTGDYRLLNPIARGQNEVEFEDYPFLPNKMTKAMCKLSRTDVLPYVQVLNSALSKLPALSSTQRLWRGHRRKVSHEMGSIIVLRGFSSVSRDRDNALEFAAKPNEGRSDKRTLLAFIEHFSSRCIAKLSARPAEMEVLFPLDTSFDVVAPPQDSENDKAVVQQATERLREKMPNAEIDLVYLKEVKHADWA